MEVKGGKDEAETHCLGRGGVGDVVLPGGQRQRHLVELHKDRDSEGLVSAHFLGEACLFYSFDCSYEKQKKGLERVSP